MGRLGCYVAALLFCGGVWLFGLATAAGANHCVDANEESPTCDTSGSLPPKSHWITEDDVALLGAVVALGVGVVVGAELIGSRS